MDYLTCEYLTHSGSGRALRVSTLPQGQLQCEPQDYILAPIHFNTFINDQKEEKNYPQQR